MHGIHANDVSPWSGEAVGLDRLVPLLDGRLVPYVNLDNAASTPPRRVVVDAIERFLPCYSSVHRGSGCKSRVRTAAYGEDHEIVARFVGADQGPHTPSFQLPGEMRI